MPRIQRSGSSFPKGLKLKQASSRVKSSRFHLFYLFAVFSYLVVVGRLFYWQVLKAPELAAVAEQQRTSVVLKQSGRGNILSSDGNILVTNKDVFTLFVEPKKLEISVDELVTRISPILARASYSELASPSGTLEEFEKQWVITVKSRLQDSTRSWVSLKQKLESSYADEITSLSITGLGLERGQTRYYPDASMAAQILGFVGKDEQGNDKGYFGIEGAFDLELQPSRGFLRREKDASGLAIPIGDQSQVSERPGRTIKTSIRREYQVILEEELLKGIERYGSKTAEGIILDPRTGRILAAGSYPNYDPQMFAQFDPSLYRFPPLVDLYEPGSTFKILTVAAGIDAGVITPETLCDSCAGPRTIAGFTIKTWNDTYDPTRTMTQALAASDNTAMIFISEKLGIERFVEYLKRFRVHVASNTGFVEEASPVFRSSWKPIDAATASFGQGIAMTGIQVASIAQAIANDGLLLQPSILESVIEDGVENPAPIVEVEQVISPESAETVTQMMIEAVQSGDAKWAVPDNVKIAGKTGTAQIPISGHYDEEKTIASFVGFAPAENPKFVMLIKLNEPTSSPWGSETAAPLWFSVAKRLLMLPE